MNETSLLNIEASVHTVRIMVRIMGQEALAGVLG